MMIATLVLPRVVDAKKLNIAIGSSPNNLDPHYATDANSQDINRLIHLSLVDASRQMKTVCRACDKFESRIDGKSQIIRLWIKDNLKFQDQTAVLADDIVLSTKNLLAKKDAPIPALFQNLVNAEKVSDKIVDLYFDEYRPENLTNLSLLKIENWKKGNRVAAGEYKLIQKDENEIIIQSALQTIHFKVVGDETTAALKLLNGEIDLIATTISPRKSFWLSTQKEIKTFEVEGSNYVYISPQHRHPDLKKRNVRRALSHLIPREILAKYKMKDTVALSQGMYSKAFEDLNLPNEPIKYDQEKAKELLLKEGYVFENGRWKKEDHQLEFTLKVSNKKHIIELAKAIAPYWNKFGIPLKIQSLEWGSFYRDLKQGNYDLALGQWIGFVGPDQMGFTFLTSSIPPGGANRGFYEDPIFDELYSSALKETSEPKALEYYRKAYTRLIENEAYISLWHPKIVWIGRDCIKSIELYPTGNFLALEAMEHVCHN